MSWCDRRAALALIAGAALAAAGCGFQPLYGKGGEGAALTGQVALSGVEGRLGYAFRDRLRQRVGDPAPDARLRLTVALSFDQTGLLISRQDDVTRYDVIGVARYALRDAADNAEVATGVVRSTSGYSTLASPYATRVAERDAERRVAEDLAERVFARLVALPVRGPKDAPFLRPLQERTGL